MGGRAGVSKGEHATSKSHADLATAGTWRSDRHAGLVDVGGVASEEHDSKLWHLLDRWQMVFAEAEERLADGITIVNAGGQVQPSPALKAMKEASLEIREISKVLGIGPLNRARLGAGRDDDAAGSDVPGAPPRQRS